MKFRKKPIVVEAKQWFPPKDHRHDPTMLNHRRGNSVSPPDYRRTGDIYCFTDGDGAGPGFRGDLYFIRVGEPNDNIQIHPGDWIITGTKGEKYPCRDDIFNETHEVVSD